MKAVRLERKDTCGSDSTWDGTPPEDLRPAKIVSVGIIVADEEAYLTIGSSCDDNGPPKWDGLLCIPKTAITRRSELEF